MEYQVELVFNEYAEDKDGQRVVSKESLARIVDDVGGGSMGRPAPREA